MIDPFRSGWSGATGIACTDVNPARAAPARRAAAIKFFMRFLPALANLRGYGATLAGSFDHAAVRARIAQTARQRRTTGDPRSASAPGNCRPDPLVQIIPGDLGDDLKAGDRTRDLDPARHEPADREGIQRSHRPPAYGFDDRSCVCLCGAEQNNPVCLPFDNAGNLTRPALSACPSHALRPMPKSQGCSWSGSAFCCILLKDIP